MPRVLSAFRQSQRPRQLRRGIYVLPSLLTIANMFCGWGCVVYAMRGDYAIAAPLVGFAMVLDMLDGRIARLTGATSEFGKQMDSLADVISFGVAPATLVFAWGLEPLGRLGWAASFLYITATAMRLARFNIQGKGNDKRSFVGLPSPPAAGVLAASVFAYPVGLEGVREALFALLMVLLPAALMVSRIKFRSITSMIPEGRRSSLNLFVIAAVIAGVAVHPQGVLLGMAYAYLASGLLGVVVTRLRHRQASVSKRPASVHTADEDVDVNQRTA